MQNPAGRQSSQLPCTLLALRGRLPQPSLDWEQAAPFPSSAWSQGRVRQPPPAARWPRASGLCRTRPQAPGKGHLHSPKGALASSSHFRPGGWTATAPEPFPHLQISPGGRSRPRRPSTTRATPQAPSGVALERLPKTPLSSLVASCPLQGRAWRFLGLMFAMGPRVWAARGLAGRERPMSLPGQRLRLSMGSGCSHGPESPGSPQAR